MNENIKINPAILKNYLGDKDQYIIMSCIRCSCFDDLVNHLNHRDVEFLEKFPFIVDTSCFQTRLKKIHLKQNLIDSISDDIYNVTLVKRKSLYYKVRIIKTEESENFVKICHQFFDH